MDNCFVKLTPKSTVREELLELCTNDNSWIDPAIGTFLQKKPPKNIIFKDPFLKHICENYISGYGYDECVHIFMIKPWTHYIMHSDAFRSASINLLVNNYTDSISYFQASRPYNKLHIDIKELNYERDSYYLFNSKIPHAVTNREPARYVLSITLKYDYLTMLNHLNDQILL